MTLIALEMPDDPTALADWLEHQVVGMHLGELIAELSAMYPGSGQTLTLDEVLGSDGPLAITQGLSAVPLKTLGQLLRHPQVLLELQERVLVEGGPSWQAVPLAGDHRAAVERQKKGLRQALYAPASAPLTKSEQPWWKRRGVFAAAAAVAVMLVLAVFPWPRPPSADWGWGRPGALAVELPAPQYMNRLADEANQWFDEKPATTAALVRRLREMRYGCDVVQAAAHKPLSEVDRAWLLQKCRDWAAKFDRQIADLKAGAAPDVVRSQADATIHKLIGALKNRAVKLS